jgi:hypothetical protein
MNDNLVSNTLAGWGLRENLAEGLGQNLSQFGPGLAQPTADAVHSLLVDSELLRGQIVSHAHQLWPRNRRWQ